MTNVAVVKQSKTMIWKLGSLLMGLVAYAEVGSSETNDSMSLIKVGLKFSYISHFYPAQYSVRALHFHIS